MKKILNILLILLLAIMVMAVARDLIIKNVIEKAVLMATGMKMDIGQLKVSVPKTSISIRDMVISNPEGFSDKIMLNMPEVYVDYELLPLLKKEVHLRELRINLKEFTIVRGIDGKTNLEQVRGLKDRKNKPGKEKRAGGLSNLNIDSLSLKIGKVVY